MSENPVTHSAPAPVNQSTRLVVSWLIVGVPLAYALWQTVTSVIPLFTS